MLIDSTKSNIEQLNKIFTMSQEKERCSGKKKPKKTIKRK